MPDVEPLMHAHTTKRSTRQSAPMSAEGTYPMTLARVSGQQGGQT